MFNDSLMATNLYASKKMIKYCDELIKETSKQLLKDIESKIDRMNGFELRTHINSLEFSINEALKHKKPEKIKHFTMSYGFDIKNGKKYKKEAVMVKIEDILEMILQNPAVQAEFENYKNIDIALYHDEILIVNPLGNLIIVFCEILVNKNTDV